MAWLCKDKDGTEWVYPSEPIRFYDDCLGEWDRTEMGNVPVKIPTGSIAKLIGKELTWEDEPVEI